MGGRRRAQPVQVRTPIDTHTKQSLNPTQTLRHIRYEGLSRYRNKKEDNSNQMVAQTWTDRAHGGPTTTGKGGQGTPTPSQVYTTLTYYNIMQLKKN